VWKMRTGRNQVVVAGNLPERASESGAIARLEQRTLALERQLSSVRFLLGSILGSAAGIFLGDRPGAVIGLIAGGGIALFGRLIPALLAGGIAGGFIAYEQFADDIGTVAGVVVDTLFAGCVSEIGRPVRRDRATLPCGPTDPA
jgi:hypothetical protein